MIKYVLIYLWIYIGVHCAVIEAGDADEHVHIKLHMPKTGTRKSVNHPHHHHTRRRHKKNPPPYAPAQGHAHLAPMPPSAMGSGPGPTQSQVYHETPHNNYLTASASQQSSTPHYFHGHHHMNKLPSSVTHLHPVGGGGGGGHQQQQQLMDSEYYTTTAEGGTGIGGAVSAASATSGLGSNGDFMLNEYLTSNFASFPQPTTFETEIMSPQTNAELAYHSQRTREEEQQHAHSHLHHPQYNKQHNNPHHYEAAEHELDEDNEILETLGRTTSSQMGGGSEWTTTHQAKPYGGLSSLKTMKNEHLLKHIMQQHPTFPYQPEITTKPVAMLRASNAGKYRDDKLHKTSTEGERNDVMEAMSAYDEDMGMGGMDMATAYSDGGQQGGGVGGGGGVVDGAGGIKALTVDDIWSQLQRTYLNKYTPQAQPATGADDSASSAPSVSTKKHKRNSQKLKTRKRHQHHTRSATPLPTPTPTSFSALRTLNYENNYYNQEHPVKHSSFYDNQQHHHSPANSYSSSSSSSSSFTPFSYGSLSPTDTDLFETRATVATRPYHSFNSATAFDAAPAPDDNDGLDDEDNVDHHVVDEDDTAVVSYSIDSSIDDDTLQLQHSGEDISSEESMFSPSHKKFGNNRSHRHSHSSVAYGNANLNSPPFNYHDLYASYSTPISATIATHHVPVSTYHPNSYSASPPPAPSAAVSQQQQQQQSQSSGPSHNHGSTSYQWREQQHYPASYQAYHTSSQQQQYGHNRPQHHQLQQYQPQTTSALRLPKATQASTAASSLSSSSLTQHHPLVLTASVAAPSSPPPSSTAFSANDFTAAVKQSSLQEQQQRYKKRKNRLKSKRNRIVVT